MIPITLSLSRLFYIMSLILFITNSARAQVINPSASPWSEGWSFQTVQKEEWRLIQGEGALTKHPDKLSAFIAANTTVSWELITEPVWVNRFPLVHMRYRARGLMNTKQTPLVAIFPGSTGPVTPGAANVENPLARAGAASVVPDPSTLQNGEEHSLTVPCTPSQSKLNRSIELC